MKYVTLEIAILTFNTFIQFSAWENGTISIFIGDENQWYSHDTGIVFDVNYLVISAYGSTQCCWQMFAGIHTYLILIAMTKNDNAISNLHFTALLHYMMCLHTYQIPLVMTQMLP